MSESSLDDEASREIGERFFRTAAVFYFLIAVAGVVWIGLDRGAVPLTLFVEPGGFLVDLGLGVAAGLLLLGLWQGGRRILPGAIGLENKLAELLVGIKPSEAVALALISGFSEELFFRGAVQTSFGWFWATAIFAAMHTGRGRGFGLWTGFAVVAGAMFAGLTVWRESLLAAIIGHAVVNTVQLLRLVRRGVEPTPT